MIKISDLFEIKYGNSLELVSLELDNSGINFISRTSKKNGVSAKVKRLADIEPFSSGSITVAVSGNVLETFLQPEPFYTAFHVMVLSPKLKMTLEQKLFYCLCIYSNKYKYSYGRQANSTLKDILVPSFDDLPSWLKSFSVVEYKQRLLGGVTYTQTKRQTILSTKLVELSELFDVKNGLASSEVKRHETKIDSSYIPYIRPSYRQETSIDAFVLKSDIDLKYIFPPETLYVSTDGQGSHSYSYVSTCEFVPNSNVSVLIPRKEMSLSEKLYYSHCISNNRYKFSYGRKPKGDRLKSILVPETAPMFISDNTIKKLISEWKQ